MRVLVIEDDERLAKLMRQVLTQEGHQVDVAHDGENGLYLALETPYDVAVVDWMLPKRDGPAVCREIRAARVPLPILMLTARGMVEDRVAGLDSGADDYLLKPFAFDELLARIRALGRRWDSESSTELRCGSLVLDLRAHSARRDDQPLDLTATEWNMLEFFMRHPGQSLSRQQILDYVWSLERDVQITMVDVYISYLRRKLNRAGRPDPIETVRGIGYRLEVSRA